MSFNSKLTITCDYCNKTELKTEAQDTVTANTKAEGLGWEKFIYPPRNKCMHICPTCKEDDQCD